MIFFPIIFEWVIKVCWKLHPVYYISLKYPAYIINPLYVYSEQFKIITFNSERIKYTCIRSIQNYRQSIIR